MFDMERVRRALAANAATFIKLRHDIHAHPETGFEEVRTAAIVADLLRGFGLQVETGIATTGVVATLKGDRDGSRSIALRADLDALHLDERNPFDHRSRTPGKMHACGHDGHTVMLLAAAGWLADNRDFAGTVHFVFQPAEEGLGGGREMIREGLFERFPVDAIYGLHNLPGTAAGEFALRPGPMMAASDTWRVTFRGSGGHGGFGPHLATDTTMPLAHFLLATQTIIGRNVPAIDTAVISVGHLTGGSAGSPNIMPAEVTVSGTARSYTHEVRDLIDRRLGETARSLAQAYGCTAEFAYNRRYPPLINHEAQTAIAIEAARLVAGPERVDAAMPPITSGEDFSFMLMERPGAFAMIGNGVGADGAFINVHSPDYEFNDAIIVPGAAYWIALVHVELGLQTSAEDAAVISA